MEEESTAVTENSSVFDESSDRSSKRATVICTFEQLTNDTCFVILLNAIAITFQQDPVPMIHRKLGLFSSKPNLLLKIVFFSLKKKDYLAWFRRLICRKLFEASAPRPISIAIWTSFFPAFSQESSKAVAKEENQEKW